MTRSSGAVTGHQDQVYKIRDAGPRVLDIPQRQRPREIFDRVGPEKVEDDVLVALVLRSGVAGMSVVELAKRLLQHYGSLTALSQASVSELAEMPGMGKVKAQVLKAALELAKRLSQESVPDKVTVSTPGEAAGLLRDEARSREEEAFWVLALDAKNRLKRPPFEISQGILDASLIHPREVFKEAIRSSSAAIVLAHNHPSGDPQPSAEDIRVTRQIVEAGKIVDIDVLDHVILGRRKRDGETDYFSMREAGLVNFEV
jgi:DNA repair protein RadC